MNYVDTHHHLVLRERLGYAWIDDIAALAGRNFTLGDYKLDASGRIDDAYYMETGVDDADYKAEARLVAQLIAQGRFLGQIASCRLTDPTCADWFEECAELGVRAFRQILHVVPDDFSDDPLFRANLGLLERLGLPFELCLRADQLWIGANLAKAFPNMRFIINHCGNPDVASNGFAPWARNLAEFKQLETVSIKLSGITANASASQQTDEFLFPYMRCVIDTFGPKRVVWGSDWPVCNTGMGMPNWVAMCDRFLSTYPDNEADDIARTNALCIYGSAKVD